MLVCARPTRVVKAYPGYFTSGLQPKTHMGTAPIFIGA